MIYETGIVVAVDCACLWVETVQKTTCGSCASRNGCGQRILAKLTGKSNQIRVPQHNSALNYSVGDEVEIAIPEQVLVGGALVVYMLPLLALIVGAGLASRFFDAEWIIIISALLGFVLSAAAIRLYSLFAQHDGRHCPIITAHIPATPTDQAINIVV